jgi:hypothetical protein
VSLGHICPRKPGLTRKPSKPQEAGTVVQREGGKRDHSNICMVFHVLNIYCHLAMILYLVLTIVLWLLLSLSLIKKLKVLEDKYIPG